MNPSSEPAVPLPCPGGLWPQLGFTEPHVAPLQLVLPVLKGPQPCLAAGHHAQRVSGQEQILGKQTCSCHTKHAAETCTQPKIVLAISLCPSLCRPPVLPPGWVVGGSASGGSAHLRAAGRGQRGHRSLSLLHPPPEKAPGAQGGIARAADPHSPWRCRPAMHRLPRRSPCPSLHLGLKYL